MEDFPSRLEGHLLMDIDYLLWLQSIRESLPAFAQKILEFMGSEAAIAAAVIVPCVIYWCLNKAAGTFALLAYGASSVCNQLIKNFVCAYRPWVRDARVKPDPVAIKGAGGYSFPSGHTQSAASMMIGLGWWYRKKRWPLVLSIIFAVIVGHTRNLLGVHTPQDVIVGFLEGCLFVALAEKALPWMEREGNDVKAVAIGLVATVVFLLVVTFKPYPVDYVNGEVLVDPAEMLVGCYKVAGVFAGVLVGWLVERRYVRFETGGLSFFEGALRVVTGAVIIAICYLVIGRGAIALLGENGGQLVRHTLVFFAVVAGAPALFAPLGRLVGRRKS